MKKLEIGIFLPIAKNGFVFSTNAPPYDPSYKTNLQITRAAEEIGLDYVFAMSKWRGFGGTTSFWDSALESFSLMSALAAETSRIDLVATVNPLLYHPVLMAKMAATIADASEGRLRLNIITGATLGEYAQMGLVPEDYNENRYEYASEWIQVLRRLWSEPSVTHQGTYFQLSDCVSDPKPVRHPQIVCAGTSDEGLRFTARETDVSFISGRTLAEAKHKAQRAKQIAKEEKKQIKTSVALNLIMRDTQKESEAYSEFLIEGADVVAVTNVGTAQLKESRERSQKHGAARLADPRRIYFGMPVVGDPAMVAETIADLSDDGDIDSILLIFPDYMEGLERFGTKVMPRLKEMPKIALSDAASKISA